MHAVLDAVQLTPPHLAASALVVFCAAVVRGFTGFGFSMLAVTALSLVQPPAEVVPMVLLLEIGASVRLLPSVWQHVDWRSLRWLFVGTVVATPLGVYGLSAVPANTMRCLVSAAVGGAVVLLWRGFTLQRTPGVVATLATGVLVGVLNGSSGIGGPPAILFYFSSPVGVTVSRASLITYFLAIDIVASVVGAAYGLVTTDIVLRAVLLLLPLAVGVAIGDRQFARTNPAVFRRVVLVVLLLLSAGGLLRAAYGQTTDNRQQTSCR